MQTKEDNSVECKNDNTVLNDDDIATF